MRIRIRNLFDPGSGMEKIGIRDKKNPGSATLIHMIRFVFSLFRPKVKRIRNLGGATNTMGDMSPAFGVLLGQTPSPTSGVAAKILEFSSPQLMLLSPAGSSPPPVRALKSSLTSTPVPLPR
jgi:hypothetical protein